MKIKDILEKKEHTVSFEIFPPNKNFSEEKLKNIIKKFTKHIFCSTICLEIQI